jgi:hypothetical protein
MRPSTLAGLLVIAVMAIVVLLYAPGTGWRAHDLCPHPVYLQGRTVSCDGTMPAPDPSPRASR